MNETQNEQIEIDLLEILGLLRRRWYIIFVVTVLCGVIGFFGTKYLITPQYEASVNMIVNTRTDASTTVSNDNISSAKSLVDTYAIIIKGNTVLNEVIDRLGLTIDGQPMKYDDLESKITVSAVNSTQVMRVSVTDPDPVLAIKIVKEIASISPKEIVDAVEAGSCKVISQVTATDEPVSPSIVKNTAIAALVGMVFAMAAIIVKDLLSNYIIDDVDVEKHLGLSVIGVIPEVGED